MMFRKFLYLQVLFILIGNIAFATSEWEGNWIYERYNDSQSGSMQISDCQEDICKFDLKTFHGAHTCSIKGTIKISDDESVFTETLDFFENEPPINALVKMKLDRKKHKITILNDGDGHRMYCGMRGYFEGEYESENNPLRYETSFDCWAEDLTETQKAICASMDISAADLELAKEYKNAQTPQWLNERENCGTDEKCLWDFYVKKHKEEYTKHKQSPINFYEYIKEKNLEYFYPTSLILVKEFLLTHMSKNDYDAMAVSLSDVYDEKGEGFFYYTYGVAGLYTEYESALYIDKEDMWLAFISANLENGDDEYIIVYAPKNKAENDIPQQYDEWLTRLKKEYPKGIKFKHFKEYP